MFKGIPKIAWVMAIGGIFILLFYMLQKYVNGAKALFSTFTSIFKNPFANDDTELNEEEKNNINYWELTPNINHTSIAEKQYNAMYGIGTNETLLFAPYEKHNLTTSDLELIYQKFGKQKPRLSQTPKTLTEWYQKELSGKKLKLIRAYWQNSPRAF